MKPDVGPITLTDAARDHIQSKIDEREDGWGIYVGVKAAGCSGNRYVIEYWDGAKCNQTFGRTIGMRPYHVNGINVVATDGQLPYFQGMEIDFVKEGLNEGLKFNNPLAKDACGCGETFSV